MLNFKKQIKPKNSAEKRQKENILKNFYAFFDGREMVLETFESRIFPINKIKGTGFLDFYHSNLKILTPT